MYQHCHQHYHCVVGATTPDVVAVAAIVVVVVVLKQDTQLTNIILRPY